jgi:hypothetical protein
MENIKLFKFELSFFQVLQEISKKSSLFLKIPDTLILGFGFETITLFTTDPDTGKLLIRKKLSSEALQESFQYFSDIENDPFFPIALFKTSETQDTSHSHLLFSPSECLETWLEVEKTGKSGKPGKCIQKFIHNSSTISIFKATWDNIESKATISRKTKHKNIRLLNENTKKILTSTKRKMLAKEMKIKAEREKFLVLQNDKELKVKTCVIPEIDRKMVYLVYVFERFFLQDPNLKVISFEADWIEDGFGECFLVGVKKYRIARVKAVRQNISLFQIPRDPVPIPKQRACISFSKKVKSSSKLSKSCNIPFS